MQIIEWNDSYLLGIKEFDDHHKYLVGLLNKAYEVAASDESAENVRMILDDLADYATFHFAAEEHWMKEYGYPRLAEHSDEHDAFSYKVTQILKDIQSGNDFPALNILIFLNRWLADHILGSDADYGRYYAGISAGNEHPATYP